MKILSISGSLRRGSYNTAVLHQLNKMAPKHWQWQHFEDLATLPCFDPNWGDRAVPPPVQYLFNKINSAEAVVLSTPEYAHGMPGVLKNLLDWCVGYSSFSGKPTLALSASPGYSGGKWAHADLLETLSLIEANIITTQQTQLAFISQSINQQGEIIDAEFKQGLHLLLDKLAQVAA